MQPMHLFNLKKKIKKKKTNILTKKKKKFTSDATYIHKKNRCIRKKEKKHSLWVKKFISI
jgi:hypothetical protein